MGSAGEQLQTLIHPLPTSPQNRDAVEALAAGARAAEGPGAVTGVGHVAWEGHTQQFV